MIVATHFLHSFGLLIKKAEHTPSYAAGPLCLQGEQIYLHSFLCKGGGGQLPSAGHFIAAATTADLGILKIDKNVQK